MAQTEADIINHLLNIERAASEVLSQAQTEAEKRISSAKATADKEFKTQYDAIVASEEARLVSETDAVMQKYNADVAAYKEKLAAAAKSVPSFNTFLDTVLFAS